MAWFHYGDGVVLDRKRLEEYVRQNGLDAQAYGEMADRVEKACYQNPYQPGFRSDRFTEEQKRSALFHCGYLHLVRRPYGHGLRKKF